MGITRVGGESNDYIVTTFGPMTTTRITSEGSVVWTTPAHFRLTNNVAMLQDGRVVVSDFYGNRIVLLDAATGAMLGNLGYVP